MTATAPPAPRLVHGEALRWHAGRLWVCDWERRDVATLDSGGGRRVIVTVPSVPFTIDWTADGRLVVLAGPDLLAHDGHGRLRRLAPLSALGAEGWNEVVADGRGGAYVDAVGADPATPCEPGSGTIALVDAEGRARVVADGLTAPGSMAITPDGATLLVAEPPAHRITAFTRGADGELTGRRVWAHLGHVEPDSLSLDSDGAVWCSDVPHGRCLRVRAGGDVLQVVPTGRGWFSCVLADGAEPALHVVGAFWTGPVPSVHGEPLGRWRTEPAPAPPAARVRDQHAPAGSPVGRCRAPARPRPAGAVAR